MALLVKYKCEQTNNPSIFINLAQENIKHVKDTNNNSIQDINTNERERDEQSQTQENYFKVRAHFLYVPTFNTMKDFH